MGESIVKTEDPVGRAAQYAADRLREAIALRNCARFAISGGSSAKVTGLVREKLGAEAWGRVRLTWIDERCVPFADPDSNRGQAYRAGFLSEEEKPLQEVPLWLDDETPKQAIARVEKAIGDDFEDGLDVVFYGLGEDGHIASIFPGKPATYQRGTIALVPDSPKPPAQRMTLLLELLRTAAHAFLVVSGESKREALQRVVSGDTSMPANILPELTIVTDLELEVS